MNGGFSALSGFLTITDYDRVGSENRLVTENFAQSLQHLGLDAHVADLASVSPSDLVATYGASAATKSARLPGAIFSILAGTPAIALAADPKKSEGVIAEVGLRDWVLPMDPTKRDDLFNRLVELTHPSVAEERRLRIEQAALRVGFAELRIQILLKQPTSTSGVSP